MTYNVFSGTLNPTHSLTHSLTPSYRLYVHVIFNVRISPTPDVAFVTSAKEVMFLSLFVCLFVCLSVCLLATSRTNFRTDLHEIFSEVGNGPMNK